ncbi:glutamate receptor U1-like [Schistocerca americana]|uniref:glutamate receptor U1-like n=1 Tax=Schistocerca americana TaxID=7009 RepID=UPI001F4FB2F0|nr:glutamate receptor U1-like [Schistocerca americana]
MAITKDVARNKENPSQQREGRKVYRELSGHQDGSAGWKSRGLLEIALDKDADLAHSGLSAMRTWSRRGLRASVHVPEEVRPDLGALLSTTRGAVAVCTALSCPAALQIFRKAAGRQLLGAQRHWLLLGESDPDQLPQLALDSSVTLATPDTATPGSWLLRDVYGLGTRLVVSPPVVWQPGSPMPAPPSRDNLQGLAIKAGIVKVHDDFSRYDDLRYRHLDTWSKLHYAISKVAAARLNFTHNIVFADQWGTRVTKDMFNGQVGQIQRGEVDVAVGGVALRAERSDAIDYTTPTGLFQPAFMFREPSLAAVSNVYTRPFSRGVWLSYSLAALLLALLVVASQRLLARAQGVLSATADPAVAPPWADVPLVAFSIVCEEGMQDPPQNASSRILLMFLLVLAVFHMTAYSACIVTLLQLPSSSIKTLESLFSSKMRIVIHDLPYNINYGNETKDPLIKSFYRERVYSQPRKAFRPLEDCVAQMREGGVACHADEAAYKVIGDTFLESEKCSLKAVPMFPLRGIIMAVRKQSQYKETFSRTLTWLRETGLLKREWTRWVAQKPRCLNRDSGYAEVGLTEVSPALLMVCYGVAASLAALLFEVLLHRLVAARQGHHKRQQKPGTENTLVPRAFLR